jgi:hypothetical protein
LRNSGIQGQFAESADIPGPSGPVPAFSPSGALMREPRNIQEFRLLLSRNFTPKETFNVGIEESRNSLLVNGNLRSPETFLRRNSGIQEQIDDEQKLQIPQKLPRGDSRIQEHLDWKQKLWPPETLMWGFSNSRTASLPTET